jgi:type IV secretory pathway VirB2 component (pilin)
VKNRSKQAFRRVINWATYYWGTLLVVSLFSVKPMFAIGTSPYSSFATAFATEMTGPIATGGAAIGLVAGLIAVFFGHHQFKSWAVGAVVLCVALLSINAIITWL